MARFIASMLFKDKENSILPYLIKYNSGDIPQEESFETIKKYIEEREGVHYYAGQPVPCYSDNRYIEVYNKIEKEKDYTFLFSSKPRDQDKFKKPIPVKKGK